MIRNIEYKNQVLKENYREYCNNSEDGNGDGMSFKDYVERESEYDPFFYDFLYDTVEGYDIPDEEELKEDLCELINY